MSNYNYLKMKKFYLCFIGLLLGLNMSYSQTNMSSEMYDLAKMKEGYETAVSAVMTARATTATT